MAISAHAARSKKAIPTIDAQHLFTASSIRLPSSLPNSPTRRIVFPYRFISMMNGSRWTPAPSSLLKER